MVPSHVRGLPAGKGGSAECRSSIWIPQTTSHTALRVRPWLARSPRRPRTVEVDATELVGDIVAALQKQGADVSMEGGEEEMPEDGEEMEPAMGDEELPPEEGGEAPLMHELEKAGIKLAEDEATINEVARRVAARLIKASKSTKR